MTVACDSAVLTPPREIGAPVRGGADRRDDSDRLLELSRQLLRTLGTALDVREIFGNMARIVQRFLPNDGLVLLLYDDSGRVEVRASSGDAPTGWVGSVNARPVTDVPAFSVVDDLAIDPRLVRQTDLRDRAVAAGYRSILEVLSFADQQRLRLQFWSKRRAAFSPADFVISGCVAEHVALAIAHEQLACRQAKVHDRTGSRPLVSERRARASEVPLHVVTGASNAWVAVLKQASQVAVTDSTVLLTGESGTGKEVVARYIHEYSRRRGDPFVAVNCAAFPEQLLEAELFGYDRGAFTGATHGKPGHLERAGQGVLFLDEIGDMPRAAQVKLLRVVQEREFQRLGGTRVQRAHARMIAATNRNLRDAVQRGDFREDLYYRLQVFEIHLPPLRERPTDILPLAQHFLQEVGRTVGRPSRGLAPNAADALLRYRWPGNVRQLRNVLERATIVCDGGLITTEHLLLPPSDLVATGATTVCAVERDLIERVLRECTGNKSQAARRLGVSRKQLYFRLNKYGIG